VPAHFRFIRAFRAHYKRRWLQYQLDKYEVGENPHQTMNVLQALRWSVEAWREDITDTTITNCWLKSRVLKGQMMPPTKWKAQQMGWTEAVQEDETSYNNAVDLARAAIKELENRQFIKEGQHVATFLNPPDEIVDDDPDDDQFIDQLVYGYTRGPDIDPDTKEAPIPTDISIPQALSAVTTLRAYAEQQKDDYRSLIQQLGTLERQMKAEEVACKTQITLDRFFIAK
jgi:DDE superfamily endonuclease